MFILSQNKEKLYNLSGHIEGIGYEETKEYVKGKKEDKIRHTLMVYDGCCEEVAEYETKEDCMLILYAVFKAMEQGVNALELPTQEETDKQKAKKAQQKKGRYYTALYKQAGNSIAVPIFESIFRKIILNETQERREQT